MPPQSWSEHLDSRGGSCNEFAALVLIKRNPDWNALRQPHPVEGRIDVGEEGCAGAAVAVFDTGRDAFYASAQRVGTAAQPHIDGIAEVDTRQLGFLEIALDAQRVGIEQRQHALARREIGPRTQL